MRKSIALTVAAVLGFGVLAACSKSSTDTVSGAPSGQGTQPTSARGTEAPGTTEGRGSGKLSKDEVVERGDEICVEARAEIAEASSLTSNDPSQVEAALEEVVLIAQTQLARLDELAGQSEDPQELRDVLEKVGEYYALVEERIPDIAADQSAGTADSLERARVEASEAAADYGFVECGQGASSGSGSSGSGSSGSGSSSNRSTGGSGDTTRRTR
jgi:hypothetical protein